ncbi:MAG: hypothetical protein QMD50_03465 [Patescibacteria group bacterium]|nr:hypothetical protein [Patescibacteria group bacterium]
MLTKTFFILAILAVVFISGCADKPFSKKIYVTRVFIHESDHFSFLVNVRGNEYKIIDFSHFCASDSIHIFADVASDEPMWIEKRHDLE